MTEEAAKKPYKRRLTDKRREQNRAAQKAWREKQKKELETLKAQAEVRHDVTRDKSNIVPPPRSHPPFTEFVDPVRNDDIGETKMMCALSLEHWTMVASYRLTQDKTEKASFSSRMKMSTSHDAYQQSGTDVIGPNTAIPLQNTAEGVDFNPLDDWDATYDLGTVDNNHWYYSLEPLAPSSSTQVAQKTSHPLTPAWTDINMPNNFTFATTVAMSGVLPPPDLSLLSNFLPTDNHNMKALTTTSTKDTTSYTTTPASDAWSCMPALTRTVRMQSISIHLACVENARMLGITPEAAFRTHFSSPFHRAPMGPPTFNDSISSFDPNDPVALWYDRGKACGWKNIKKWLRPTPAQLLKPHGLWLDTIPFPTIRERMLLLLHEIDAPDLANDMAFNHGLICWARGDGQDRDIRSGTPWDVRNWEVKPWFASKWWASGVLGDEDGEVWEQCVWWAQWRKGEGEDVQGLDELMQEYGIA